MDNVSIRFKTLRVDENPGQLTCHDVVNIPGVYGVEIYNRIRREVEASNLLPWHKNHHLVVDYRSFKDCPTIKYVIQDVCKLFKIIPIVRRVNVFRGGERGHLSTSDYKPFHHDKGAFIPGLKQNITVVVSFGATREVGFKYKGTETIISNVVTSGSIYAFCRDVNCEFQHGLLPANDKVTDTVNDRISIVVWGYNQDLDITTSRVSSVNMRPNYAELGLAKRRRLPNSRHKNT